MISPVHDAQSKKISPPSKIYASSPYSPVSPSSSYSPTSWYSLGSSDTPNASNTPNTPNTPNASNTHPATLTSPTSPTKKRRYSPDVSNDGHDDYSILEAFMDGTIPMPSEEILGTTTGPPSPPGPPGLSGSYGTNAIPYVSPTLKTQTANPLIRTGT